MINAIKSGWLKYLLVFIVIFVLIVVAIINSPAKFLSDQGDNGGVSLIRDDHEFNVYYERIGYYYEHGVPYKNERAEYPVLGLLYLTVPAFFTSTQADYNIALVIQNLICLLLLIIVTYNIINFLGTKNKQLWFFLLPSFLYFTVNRFDIWPALLIQLAVLMLIKNKFNWAFLLLSFSFLAKGYAVVLFPIFFVYYFVKNGDKIKNHIKNKPFLLFITPVIILIVGLIVWAGFENALFPYVFQSTRNFAFGSIYGSFIVLNWGYFSETFWHWFMYVGSKILGLWQLLLPLIVFLGYKKFKDFIKIPADVVRWSLLVLLFYVFLSPYYSPQWFVWLLPLFVLIPLRQKEIWAVIIFDLLNFLFFPLVYGYFGYEHIIFEVVVTARTISFIVLILFLAKNIYTQNKPLVKVENN